MILPNRIYIIYILFMKLVHKNKTKIQMVNNHNQIIRIYHGKNIKIKKLNININ